MKTFIRKPLSLALAAALGASYYGVASGALLSLSQVPLFVASGQKANVLLILDNSNSMDEDAAGSAAACVGTLCGSASPLSKSEIARSAAKSIVANYTGKINLGLMAYQQNTSGTDAVRLQRLHNSPYDASYDPANYNAAYTGSRDSLTKRYRIPNPTSSGDYIYYNVALPFYASSNQGNGFCYSQTADFDNGSETYPGGPWDSYRCYNTKTGTSDTLPTASGGGATAAGYSNYTFTSTFWPTDSDLAQGILDFGRFLTWSYVGPTWFSNSNPGRGYLHVPIGNLDATKAAALNTKLGTSQFSTNGPTTSSLPLQNAGLTPIEGTFLTAKDYFAGSLTAPAEGGPQSAPPASCNKDFVVFLTDGLPSTDASGHAVTNPAQALADAAQAASDLYTAEGVKSYIVGFALPYGTTPGSLDVIAAAGGTGTASDASDLTTLNSAFQSIFGSIVAASGSAAAVAMTSGSVAAGGKIFQGQFNSVDWSGDLIAYNTDPTTGATTSVAWHASTVLNTQNYDTGRKIITYKPSTHSGIPFRWPVNPASPTSSELDTSQTTALTSNPSLDALNTSDTGANRLNFLRGQTGINGFRTRLFNLGDVVNSAPAYVGEPAFNYPDNLEAASYYAFRAAHSSRTPIIYVGANDGMLHGFDASFAWSDTNLLVDSDGDGNLTNDHDAAVNTATSGKEVLAYVPSKVYPNLAQLTSTNYSHRFYVDGSPTVVDTFYSGAWHTTLVASLGAGGQGLYALDVTDPSTFSEANASSIVKWEFSDANDQDLGYVYGQPSIVKLNSGQWAAIFSNGYNNSEADGNASTTGYAYLYIVDIGTGSLIKKISTSAGSTTTPNALATPTLVDRDGDGDVDYAYAGDLQGNMWKFDLCNENNQGVCASNTSGWGLAYGTTPLFVARDAGGNRQPITSSVEVTRHFSGDGYQLYFGTGKYLENSDISSTGTQTFYSVWDMALSPSTISGRGDLQQQTVTTTTTVSGQDYRTSSSNAVAWVGLVSGGTKRGWYMDLPASGERVVSDPSLFSNRILFTTMIPNAASCPGGGGTGWLMELDAVTGAALGGPTFDVNGDGVVNTSDNLGTTGTYASGVSKSSIPSAVRLQKNPGGPGGGSMNKWTSMSQKNLTTNSSLENEENSLPPIQNRSSWRQIF